MQKKFRAIDSLSEGREFTFLALVVAYAHVVGRLEVEGGMRAHPLTGQRQHCVQVRTEFRTVMQFPVQTHQGVSRVVPT
jgi:hypothetical protein